MTKDLIFIKIIIILAEEHKMTWNLFCNKNIKKETETNYQGMVIDKRVTLNVIDNALRQLYQLTTFERSFSSSQQTDLHIGLCDMSITHLQKHQVLQNKFLRIVLNRTRYDQIKDLHTEAKASLLLQCLIMKKYLILKWYLKSIPT